ncbi:MAG: Lrp/AsnC family transcriptional regulator [Pseudomonadota bacterium]
MYQTGLDRLDLNILKVLQTDGRLSNAKIGGKVGLSESATFARLKRLEKSGAIVGFPGQLDLKKVSAHVIVFTLITLEDDRNEQLRRFENQVAESPEITECHYISGGFDYLLTSVAPDFERYMQVIDAIREANDNIRQYSSFLSVRKTKQTPASLDVLTGHNNSR